MKNGPDNANNVPVAPDDRFAGQLGYRVGGRREPGGIPGDPGLDLTPRNGANPLDTAAMTLGDLDSLAEPVYPPAGWLDSSPGTLADHPLLRGLLLELPPKGAMPPAEWLDRWFEAARSILELLYQHGNPHR